MHRIAITALVVALSACGGDIQIEPEPDPIVDAGTDAGTDAGSDAGTDAGSDAGTEPEPGPEPKRFTVIVVNETGRQIQAHLWTSQETSPELLSDIRGLDATEPIPLIASGGHASFEAELEAGEFFYFHFDGGRTTEVTSCSNDPNPSNSWANGIPFEATADFRWSGRGGSWGYGYASMISRSAYSPETHAVVFRVWPHDLATPETPRWCESGVSVEPL